MYYVAVKSVPYEIHESGWGEFEAVIKVYFMDSTEKMVEFFHPLRLFPIPSTDKEVDPLEPVVSEFYDEIVFQDPSEKMYNLLKSTPVGTAVSHLPVSALQPYFQDFSNHESLSLKKIEQARRRVRDETIKRQNRFEKLQNERTQLVREISRLGGEV